VNHIFLCHSIFVPNIITNSPSRLVNSFEDVEENLPKKRQVIGKKENMITKLITPCVVYIKNLQNPLLSSLLLSQK
jgi:hypothetical protein